MKSRLLITFVVFSTLLLGCRIGGVRGSGNLEEAERMLDDFSKIEISGAYDVKVEIGDESKVFISAEDNLLPLIKTVVKGNRLEIYSKKNLKPREDIYIKVTTKELTALESSGASNIRAKDIDTDKFYAELSGAGTIRLSGVTQDLKIVMSGAGTIDAKSFIADDVKVSISGACSGTVHANESLLAEVSGVGSIDYYGDPKDVSTDVSGVGSINRRSDDED
jgi:hypothetical protein